MSARTFSFASLLLATATPAMAGGYPLQQQIAEASDPQPAAQASDVQPAATMTLKGIWGVSVKNGVVTAKLTLMNYGTEAVDFVSARGASPGPGVRASISDESLSPIFTADQERGMMSRMGPMPTYAAIAPGAAFVVGTYQFTLPESYTGKTIQFEARIRSDDREALTIPFETVLGVKPAV